MKGITDRRPDEGLLYNKDYLIAQGDDNIQKIRILILTGQLYPTRREEVLKEIHKLTHNQTDSWDNLCDKFLGVKNDDSQDSPNSSSLMSATS